MATWKLNLTTEEKRLIFQTKIDVSLYRQWKLKLFGSGFCFSSHKLEDCRLIVKDGIDGIEIKVVPAIIDASGTVETAHLFDEDGNRLFQVKLSNPEDFVPEFHWTLNLMTKVRLADWMTLGNLTYPLESINIPPAWLGLTEGD